MRVLAEPNVDDECQGATKLKDSDNAEEYCDKGADGAASLAGLLCVVEVFFDLSGMKTAVHSRDVIGWVAARGIRHWSLPSRSEIG